MLTQEKYTSEKKPKTSYALHIIVYAILLGPNIIVLWILKKPSG